MFIINEFITFEVTQPTYWLKLNHCNLQAMQLQCTWEHVCCLQSLRGSKNTFYWEELRCQYLNVGFRMAKKWHCIHRFPRICWKLPFGGSRSQEVFARVGPREPGPGLYAQNRRRAWCCTCTPFFFFLQKALRNAVEAQHMRHICCLLFMYSVVLLSNRKENLVKLFLKNRNVCGI